MENEYVTPVSTKDFSARIEGVHESIPTELHVPELSPSVSQISDKSMWMHRAVKGINDLAAKGSASGIYVKSEMMEDVRCADVK